MSNIAKLLWTMATMATCLLITALALGQASQPASQPTVFVPVASSAGWAWFVANTTWIIPVALWLLANLCTVLSKYPKAKGVVSAIRMFMGGLSMFEFRDGKKPGIAFKVPVMPPEPPPALDSPKVVS